MSDEGTLPTTEAVPLGWLAMISSRLFSTAAMRILDELDISATGYAVLMVLNARDGLPATKVAELVACTPATLSTVANTLERNGHLQRRAHPDDRRVVRLHITDRGRSHAGTVRHHLRSWFDRALEHVPPEDEPAVRRFLVGTIRRLDPAGAEWTRRRTPGGRAPLETTKHDTTQHDIYRDEPHDPGTAHQLPGPGLAARATASAAADRLPEPAVAERIVAERLAALQARTGTSPVEGS